MLYNQTRLALLRDTIRRDNALALARHKVRQFDELCTVFRQLGCSFTEEVKIESGAVRFYLTPHTEGDYLAILDAASGMEARRIPSPHARLFGYDLIDPAPDAPAFWLFTFTNADVYNHQEETR